MKVFNLTLDPQIKFKKKKLGLEATNPEGEGLAVLNWFTPMIEPLLKIKGLNSVHKKLMKDDRNVSIFEKLKDAFELNIEFKSEDLKKIPKEGSLLVVANHPYAGIESISISYLISKVRSDIKLFLGRALQGVPEFQREEFIFSSPFETDHSRLLNERAARKSYVWLKKGHSLVIHPSGAVSDLNNPKNIVEDPPWQLGAAKIALHSRAQILPIYVEGNLSNFFLKLRKISTGASVFLLIPEMVKLRGKTIKIHIRDCMKPEEVEHLSQKELTDLIRSNLYR
jgi:putative hemolysin